MLSRIACGPGHRGSGVPTVGNVHEIALDSEPTARVAYVDFEPVAVAHAEQILAGHRTVTITRADLRDPASVLGAPGVADLLDLDRPVALLMIAVLHFVADPAAREALDHYRAALAPGSVVAISHVSDDHDEPEVAEQVRGAAAGYANSATPLLLRSRAELRSLVGDLELVPPGLVDVRDWPDPQPGTSGAGGYGLVARLP
ncbi:SAM-dependent methyltransferase [Actinomycetospora sp. OC33-EN08]|uniref:SAM-dependent methyltransferase n=1 Tax=Actinomycetospora aurantiaca TaxID=3129233 RepID=A0ABU8MHS6_9PSEU